MSEANVSQIQSAKDKAVDLQKNSDNGSSQPQSPSWEIFPQTLSLSVSDTSSHTFFVVNYTSNRQMLEVTFY